MRVVAARHRGELGDDAAPLVGVVAAVDPADMRVAGRLQPPGILGQAPVQVAGRVLERAEDENLLPLQVAGQQFLEPFELAVFCCQALGALAQALEQPHVGFHVMRQFP